jgi:hypothetical protein
MGRSGFSFAHATGETQMSDTKRGEFYPDETPAREDDEWPAPASGGAMPDAPLQGDEVDPGLG